ncbi:hypothetical protein NVP2275O_109 [Vibrio phage 2.275.O._10N.286.54.E11]|nr:hypothetical protein NVP2275O_109 [Vibrio phage 2.275.O._10N.286.54.E11]
MFNTDLNETEVSPRARQLAQGIINNALRNIQAGKTASEVSVLGNAQFQTCTKLCKLARDKEQLYVALNSEAKQLYLDGGLHDHTHLLIRSIGRNEYYS